MKPIILEKLVRMATFEELWSSRKPDFKARNEIKTLKRYGITATYSRVDEKTYSVRGHAMNKQQIEYLVLKRGFAMPVEKPNNKPYSDVVQTILNRPRTGSGGGIPLTRGEVAMLFLDGYAGDRPWLLDIRSQGYGDDNDWDGLTVEDVLEDEDTAFVWKKWEPLELWPD
jgi:hypothetical protein